MHPPPLHFRGGSAAYGDWKTIIGIFVTKDFPLEIMNFFQMGEGIAFPK